MPEALTVPSVMMMTSIVSEESLARGTHTHRHTHTHRQTFASSFLNCFKVVSDFENRKQAVEIPPTLGINIVRIVLGSATFTQRAFLWESDLNV